MFLSWRHRAVAIALLLLTCLNTTAALAAEDGVAREALAGYDEMVGKMIQDWSVPGLAVAIVKDGEVIYAKGFGYRDVEKKLPVTPDTLFAIGSTTKAFTTFTLGMLVDEGRLDWDKPVRTFLPGFQMYDADTTALITPRDLVTHRSGLPRHDLLWYNNNTLTRKEAVERLRYLEPNEQLRAKFQYNNLMFLTAGYLIEHLTGKSWEDSVRERILQPLGMSNTNFSVHDSQKSADFALPYREEDFKYITPIPFRDISMIGPAGSINSSVNDMAKWMQVNLNGGKVDGRQLISPSTLSDIHAPHMLIDAPPERPELSRRSYGLGWGVDTYRGHPRVHHSGGIDGFSALVTLLPQDGLGVVVLTNRENGLPERLVRHTIDRILKLDPIDWNGEALARRKKGRADAQAAEAKKDTVRKQGTKPAHKLADYAGDYENPGYGTLKVTLADDKLDVTYNGITAPLEHWHYEVWNGAEGGYDPSFEDTKFMFQGDVNGNVAAVAAQFEPQVKDIVFTRKPDARLSDPSWLARFTGEYELSGQRVTIRLTGNTLKISFPGQPEMHLQPGLGGEFVAKEFSVISVSFQEDAKGNVTGAQLNQPNSVYTMTKKK